MAHFLIEQYPTVVVPIIQFGKDHPEILTETRSRKFIANLDSRGEEVQRIFRKRFGRWYIHIPSLIEYMELEESIPAA
jgi:hypothetical protein